MINPSSIMKLMSLKNKFEENHPKFAAFTQNVLSQGIPEGTVIEITLTRPGQEPIMTNMKIKDSDLEMLQGLKDLT